MAARAAGGTMAQLCLPPRAFAPLAALLVLALASPLPRIGASHADGSYDEPILFARALSDVDVLVVPPHHGQIYNSDGLFGGRGPTEQLVYESSYLEAILDGAQNVRTAVNAYSPTWFKNAFSLRVHVLGAGPASTATPDVVVLATDAPTQTFFGRACVILVSMTSTLGGPSATYEEMRNAFTHHLLHCLGIDEVTDGHPSEDLMHHNLLAAPGSPPGSSLRCVSNLNVRALQVVFALALGQPSPTSGSVPTGSYVQTC